MKDTFIEIYTDNIKREGADKLLDWLLNSDFFEAPSSTRFHLSRPGGLLEHSINVYNRLREIYLGECERKSFGPVGLPPEDEESIAICGLLHDLCKVGIYRKEPKNQKTYDTAKVAAAWKGNVKHDSMGDYIWETVMGYKHDDKLPYGHGEKSVYIISGFMRLTRDEAMAIRWHMGFSDDSFRAGSQNVGNAFALHPLAAMTHMADLAATYFDEAEAK